MPRGLFVTGTDTNVGKTVAAASLVCRFRQVPHLRYWKPIQTGAPPDDDTAEVCRLSVCSEAQVESSGVRFEPPVSPHLAARLAGSPIDLHALAAVILSRPDDTRWIVEGAGGALVPLDERRLMTDLMTLLGFAVVIVARSALGTINHTLLTLEALRARRLHVAGVVMVGDRNSENRAAIEHYGRVSVLGELPVLNPLSSETLERWASAELDSGNRLLEWLQ